MNLHCAIFLVTFLLTIVPTSSKNETVSIFLMKAAYEFSYGNMSISLFLVKIGIW